jgi:hypothetical protein
MEDRRTCLRAETTVLSGCVRRLGGSLGGGQPSLRPLPRSHGGVVDQRFARSTYRYHRPLTRTEGVARFGRIDRSQLTSFGVVGPTRATCAGLSR